MKFATIVSRVFEPEIMLAVALFIYAIYRHIPLATAIVWVLVFILPPMMFRLWAKKAKGLDWDIHDRTKRTIPLLLLLGLIVVDVLLLWIFEISLLPLFFLFFVWALGFFLITTLWTKISGHTSGNALATGLVVTLYGWHFWPVLLIVPLVSWARVKRKDHTIGQVILGALYSWILLILIPIIPS
jgi:hypothetical protein